MPATSAPDPALLRPVVKRPAVQRPVAEGPAVQRQLVWGGVALLVGAHIAFRTWAASVAWFYGDDFRLIYQARHSTLSVSYLLRPFDSQLMPMGRGLAWLVAQAPHLDWTVAAGGSLVLVLLADLAAVWMLVTLFGARPGILAPLALYLCVAVTVPGFMWWAVSLNSLPLQVVLCASVATWVRYLRSRRTLWLVATVALFIVGLTAYVKAVFVLGVLAYLLVAYFTQGSPWQRLREVVRRWWAAGLVLGVVAVAFAAYYRTHVPQLFVSSGRRNHGAREAAVALLGRSMPTGAVGGPWHWSPLNLPIGLADPPTWGVVVAWVVLGGVVLSCAARRERTGRAWLLLALHSAGAYALLAATRAPLVGALAGQEYRYVADVAPVAALCLGLATLELPGALGSSAPREQALLRVPGWRTAGVLTVAACISGLVCSTTYVELWRHGNAPAAYVRSAAAGLDGRGVVDLADQVVPARVIPRFNTFYNHTRALVPLVSDDVRFPVQTSRLVVLDASGTPHLASVEAAVSSLPAPADGCGYRVTGTPSTVPLQHGAYDLDWWVQVAYLTGSDQQLTVRAGRTTVTAPVHRGLNNLYIHVHTALDAVTLSTSGADVVCVSRVDVGRPVPGSVL